MTEVQVKTDTTALSPAAAIRAAFEANKTRQKKILKRGASYTRKYEGSQSRSDHDSGSVLTTWSTHTPQDASGITTGEDIMKTFDEALKEGAIESDESQNSGVIYVHRVQGLVTGYSESTYCCLLLCSPSS